MKRKLFFFLEKLEIKRSERITISALLILLVGLSCLWMINEPYANYNEETYRELEQVFEKRSQEIRQERELILARYNPDRRAESQNDSELQPNRHPSQQDSTEDETPGKSRSGSELINVNTASLQKLQELPGIGPTYGQRIIEWIEKNGAFSSKDQLKKIKGIGDKRLAKIKPLITL